MSDISTTAISEAYFAKFDNYADLAHPSIFYLPEFGELLAEALRRGRALTCAEVESLFGPIAWDW